MPAALSHRQASTTSSSPARSGRAASGTTSCGGTGRPVSSTVRRPARCAPHVVAGPVADEHRRAGRHADLPEQHRERLRVRLHVRQVAGVEPHVQELEQAGVGQPALVQVARPVRVGQQPGPQPPLAQPAQHGHRRRVVLHRGLPGTVVGRQRARHVEVRLGGDRAHELLGRAAAVARPRAPLPPRVLGRQQRGRDRLRVVGRQDPRRGAPHLQQVDRPVRRQRAAPVEQHRPDRHPVSRRAHSPSP